MLSTALSDGSIFGTHQSHNLTPFVRRPINPPYSGTARQVPGTHPFDGTVLGCRQVIRFLGMMRGCELAPFSP